MKYNGLDVFDITLAKGDIGISATSLVTLPAMESNFLYFNKDKSQFIFASEEKQELIGAIMIPDKLIYRNIEGNEFYVNFTKDVISNLVSKMIKSGTAGLFTVQHKYEVSEDAIDVKEIWIKESDVDKSMDFGIDEPIGTAFMKVKVNDKRIWNAVKENGLNGFSIELDASIVEKNELLFKKETPTKMSIKDVFSNSIEVNGIELFFNSDLGKGAYLVFASEEGKPSAYSGEFNHENVIYKVEKGIVLEAENVQLSTMEAIENLSTEFKAVKDSITAIMLSKELIEQKEAELDLLKTQLESDKSAFSKQKLSGNKKVVTNMAASIVCAGEAGKNWIAKFSK